MENTEALDAYEAQLVVDIEVTVGAEKVDMLTVTDFSILDATTRNPVLYADIYMEVMGETAEAEMYVEDDWVYMLQDGNGYKMSAHEAFDEADDITETFDEYFQDLPESLFKGIKAVKNKDGSASVTLEIPNEIFEDTFADIAISVTDSITEGVDFSDLTYKNAVVEITVKDGYVMIFEIAFDLSMRVEGTRVTASVEEKLLLKDWGDGVKLDPMDGYEDFPLLSE